MHIAATLKADLQEMENDVIINLASNEYFKSVDRKKVDQRVITCHFKEMKDGQLKALMLFVKQARGAMARFVVDERITEPEQIKGFDRNGYVFREDLSTENDWIFVR